MPSFPSGGRAISIDEYSPAGGDKHPAVLLIHGSGGPLRGLDPYAERASQFGVNVFVVHYFEATGHTWVSPAQIERYFLDWLQTVRAAVDYVAAHPRVDATRIGLMGFSLGAYLALALATEDRRIAAVAELFGGMPDHFVANAAKLPPVLILHGKDDPVVPVSEALKLEQLLKRNHVSYDIKLYKGQGHTLRGLAQMDAVRRIIAFFRQTLTAKEAISSKR
jgi:dipeptidyl aminopeptidase/acylaminoacyl peptidase